MGEEHRINEIKGVIISRALLKEYGYDGDMPTDKQMQVIGNGLLEYWGVSDVSRKPSPVQWRTCSV